MRNLSKLISVPLVLLAACGGPTAAEDENPSTPSQALTTSTAVQVRLLGQDAAGFTSYLLAPRSLTATGDGVPIAVTVNHSAVELTDINQAWLIGTFTVPAHVSQVEIVLQLTNPGSVTDAHGHAALDTQGPPIRFKAPIALLAFQHKATITIDLLKSTSPKSANSRWMVPELAVHF